MRNFVKYSVLTLLVLLLAFAVSAQQKPLRSPAVLSDDATMAETQEWLTAVLTGNSSRLAQVEQPVKQIGGGTGKEKGYINSKISEVVFKGTILTYKIKQQTQFSTTGVQQQSSFPTVPQEDTTRVQLDLKDINPDEITLQDVPGDSYAQSLTLRTYDFKRTIKLKSGDTGNITVSVASIVVNTNVSEQVKNAFLHLLKLAQQP